MRRLTVIPALLIMIFLVYSMAYETSFRARLFIVLGIIFLSICTVIARIQEAGQRKNPFVLK